MNIDFEKQIENLPKKGNSIKDKLFNKDYFLRSTKFGISTIEKEEIIFDTKKSNNGTLIIIGLAILFYYVNSLTMWLTLATFFSYSVIYTIFLKPATPMNIVIGGASGAMPPILGWAAVNNTVGPEALILFLIIFCWTPPHFWALALYRRNDYAKVGIPMLPVTHGESFTLLQIVLYTISLIIVTMAPFSLGMSGLIYLICATILNAFFLYYVIMLYKKYSDKLSMKTFRYSIIYLSLIFSAMLVDHYFKFTLY